MRPCVVIPCFDHSTTIDYVARAACAHAPVVVVDDGSPTPVGRSPHYAVVRLAENRGKGTALRAAFDWAAERGYTHAVTIDADGQHLAEDLPGFLAAARADPRALIVGIRDFERAGWPPDRIRSNRFSNLWFRIETGLRLPDTQCGFRAYPVALTQQLAVRSGGYAFELEFLVRAAWCGVNIQPIAVECHYRREHLEHSHFRPVLDLAHIVAVSVGLVAQAWFVPRGRRTRWSLRSRRSLSRTARDLVAREYSRDAR